MAKASFQWKRAIYVFIYDITRLLEYNPPTNKHALYLSLSNTQTQVLKLTHTYTQRVL